MKYLTAAFHETGCFTMNTVTWRVLFTQEAINKYGFFELLLVESKSDDILIEALLSNLNFP